MTENKIKPDDVAKQATGAATKSAANKNFAFSLSRPSRCYGCDKKLLPGAIVKLEHSRDEKEAFCRSCAQLDLFEFLPKGNAKISRLANKYSPVSYIVMKWSDTWKSYERIGILVAPEAVDKAESDAGEKLKNREKPAGRI